MKGPGAGGGVCSGRAGRGIEGRSAMMVMRKPPGEQTPGERRLAVRKRSRHGGFELLREERSWRKDEFWIPCLEGFFTPFPDVSQQFGGGGGGVGEEVCGGSTLRGTILKGTLIFSVLCLPPSNKCRSRVFLTGVSTCLQAFSSFPVISVYTALET